VSRRGKRNDALRRVPNVVKKPTHVVRGMRGGRSAASPDLRGGVEKTQKKKRSKGRILPSVATRQKGGTGDVTGTSRADRSTGENDSNNKEEAAEFSKGHCLGSGSLKQQGEKKAAAHLVKCELAGWGGKRDASFALREQAVYLGRS